MKGIITAGTIGFALWFFYSLGKRGLGRTLVKIEDGINDLKAKIFNPSNLTEDVKKQEEDK